MADREAEMVEQGPSNQEVSMQMWDAMEQNYERVQRGESANFNYDPFKEDGVQNRPAS